MTRFEEMVRDAIVEAYIKVYGETKWEGLSKSEKDEVLHIALNDFCKAAGISK